MKPKLILVSEGEIEMLSKLINEIQDCVRKPISWEILDRILVNTYQIQHAFKSWRTYPEWKSPAD